MKRNGRHIGIIFLMLVFLFAAAGSVRAAEASSKSDGWYTTASGNRYYIKDGKRLKGFQTIKGKTFFFNDNGRMVVGARVLKRGNKVSKFYFKANGVMKTGWLTLKGKRYFFNEEGRAVKGFYKIKSRTFYFNENNVLQTGWQTLKRGAKTSRFYFQSNGVMTVGWLNLGEDRYYFNGNGRMLTGKKLIAGQKYWFASDGRMLRGWQTSGRTVYYFDPSTGALDETKTRTLTDLEIKCNDIVSGVVNAGDSRDTKLSKLFQYVTYHHNYVRNYNFTGARGWYRSYAYNMLTSGGGNCYSYAAAYACLVKAALPELEVRVGWGSTPAAGGGLTPHGWCEININGVWYVFDPDLYRYVYPGDCYYRTMGQVGGYYYYRNYEQVNF